MEPVFILMITGLTSVGMLIFGVRGLRLARPALWPVLGKVCECIGLTLVMFLLDLAVGAFAILAWRSLTGRFVSIYIASDTTVLILSLLQALTFQAWREVSRQHYTSESRGCA